MPSGRRNTSVARSVPPLTPEPLFCSSTAGTEGSSGTASHYTRMQQQRTSRSGCSLPCSQQVNPKPPPHPPTHPPTCTHAHTRIRTHTHTCARMRARTHAPPCPTPPVASSMPSISVSSADSSRTPASGPPLLPLSPPSSRRPACTRRATCPRGWGGVGWGDAHLGAKPCFSCWLVSTQGTPQPGERAAACTVPLGCLVCACTCDLCDSLPTRS